MKKYLLIVFVILLSIDSLLAQVPYFAGTPGDGNLYGYTSLKFRPGINRQETYNTFQYGVGEHFAIGTDLYGSNNQNYCGVLARSGYSFNKYYGIGLQCTPSFNLSDNFGFSYLTFGLYQNGSLGDSELFWVSNTWATINRDADNTLYQWWYLGYNLNLGESNSLTPMIGCIHSWNFDEDADLSVGLYYSHNKWNFYLWGNDFFSENPRIVIGVDFKLPTK